MAQDDKLKDIVSRGEDGPAEAETGKRLEGLLRELLAKHEGVFLGENHSEPAVRQAVVEMMPKLKDMGVTTISYELPQEVMDTIASQPGKDALKKVYPGMSAEQMDGLYELAKAAKDNQIRLLGHENNNVIDFDKTLRNAKPAQEEKMQNLQNRIRIMSPEEVIKRDEWSAEYIRTHKAPGKVLPIGGSSHSKRLGGEDEHRKVSPGLNVRLGIPSIDMIWAGDEPKAQTLAETYKTQGVGSDFQVLLPSDLKETLKALNLNAIPDGAPPGATPRKQPEGVRR